jgi:hypothetical protein
MPRPARSPPSAAAFGPIAAIGKAADRAEPADHETRSQEVLTAFVEAAGRQLR